MNEPSTAHNRFLRRFLGTVLSVLVLGLVGFGLLAAYQEYQGLLVRVGQLNTELVKTKTTVLETRELLALLAEGNQSLRARLLEQELFQEETTATVGEIEEQRDELLSQLGLLESELSVQREVLASGDTATVISQWSDRVGRVECLFALSDGRVGRSVGSAVAVAQGEGMSFVTNKHVVTGQNNLVPTQCSVTLSNSSEAELVAGTQIRVSADKDLGWLPITVPSEALQSVPSSMRICEATPQLGDELVILGYPSVGSMESITATEGIISGFDGDMYVTSAKIERGNSGGAAIHTRNNCFLGIPTLVVVGNIESLARILPL